MGLWKNEGVRAKAGNTEAIRNITRNDELLAERRGDLVMARHEWKGGCTWGMPSSAELAEMGCTSNPEQVHRELMEEAGWKRDPEFEAWLDRQYREPVEDTEVPF